VVQAIKWPMAALIERFAPRSYQDESIRLLDKHEVACDLK
jgi:hypothetical protein